jgi:quercetin dioxygenase-like cupin family protein
MKQKNEFVPNVDHLVPFNSQVMLVNDVTGSENGMVLILANTDGPPIHTHPLQEEVISVVEGELEVYKDKKWNKLGPGQFVYVPKNTPHTYRNRSANKCTFQYLITPKGSFSDMMITLEKLAKQRKLTSTSDFKSIVYMAMTFNKYKKDVRSVTPPPFVMTIFSWIGRLKGYTLA